MKFDRTHKIPRLFGAKGTVKLLLQIKDIVSTDAVYAFRKQWDRWRIIQ